MISTCSDSTCHIDRWGNELWNDTVLSAASLGTKGRLRVLTNTYDQAFMVWKDDRSGAADIYAQNINPDGTLGNPPVGIDDGIAWSPQTFLLEQNYPNPFNPTTTIPYALTKADLVFFKVYDMTGREVRTLVNGEEASGFHSVEWDGTDSSGMAVSTGLYFYRLEIDGQSQSRKMLFVK